MPELRPAHDRSVAAGPGSPTTPALVLRAAADPERHDLPHRPSHVGTEPVLEWERRIPASRQL